MAAHRRIAAATLQAQLVAVRRAASRAALDCRPSPERPNVALLSKQELKRDALAAAARTLAAVAASREALDMMPDAQREQLAVRLAAAGYRAVRVEGEAELAAPAAEAARV